jgi:hypothetical protein
LPSTSLAAQELQRMSTWKQRRLPVACDGPIILCTDVGQEEEKIREAIRGFITSDNDDVCSESTSTTTDHEARDLQEISAQEEETVTPDSPLILVTEGGKKIRLKLYLEWQDRDITEFYHHIPIKGPYDCREEAKLMGTYSSDEGDDNSTIESLEKIQKLLVY